MWSLNCAAVSAVIYVILTVVECQLNANPTIPDHLLECYRNNSIYHRANRLPQTLRSFLDLVRKVERSPTGKNLNARELSLALQYYLRLDGIEMSPNVQQTENIVPFSPGGDEYYKHRLALVGLLPKANQPSSYAFFNESLTTKELCNLHFMLSYSIDIYKRTDEQCSNTVIETRSRSGTYGNRRYRRDVLAKLQGEAENLKAERKLLRDAEKKDRTGKKYNPEVEKKWKRKEKEVMRRIRREAVKTLGTLRLAQKSVERQEAQRGLKGVLHELQEEKDQKRMRRDTSDTHEEEDKNVEVEVFPPPSFNDAKPDHGNKNQEFTIGREVMLGPGQTDHVLSGGLQQSNNSGNNPRPRPLPQPIPRTVLSGLDKRTTVNAAGPRSYIPNAELSQCPVENGVIQTEYGSITIGTVIAGIAAGLNRQFIDPIQLNVEKSEIKPELTNVKVDNVWATTLAGNTADMILSVGIIDDFNQAVGLKGGWNSTFDPRWYLLQNANTKYLTDVELRGALDGLWLGKNVEGWSQKYNTLKLSQILDMYYSEGGSVFDPSIQACNRRAGLVSFAPTDEFEKQVHIFSQVMKKQRINTVTITDFTTLVSTAVSNVNNYVQQWQQQCYDTPAVSPVQNCHAQMDNSCSLRSLANVASQTKIDSQINMLLAIDSSWNYEDLKSIIRYLISQEAAATLFQSNLTIICGKSGDVLASLQDSTALESNFSLTVYQTCPTGFDLSAIYYQLEQTYRYLLYQEKNVNIINTMAQVSLFMPFSSTNLQNSSDSQTKRELFRNNFPDVKFIVATTGSKDPFASLVDDSEKDVLTIRTPSITDTSFITTLQALVARIKETPQRVSKPKCGSYYTYEDGNSQVTDNIRLGYTKYYKLSPNYFFSVDTAKVTIKAIRNLPLTICHSRTNNQPSSGGSRNVPGTPTTQGYYPSQSTSTMSPGDSFRMYGRQTNGDGSISGDNCKTVTSETYEITLEDPCDDADYIKECQPLYISVYAPLPDPGSLSLSCVTCRFPSNVEYQIAIDGLSCDSGVGRLFLNPFMALCSIFVIVFSYKLF